MSALRTPVTGCPWDLKQDFASIAPYTIEEAYEVADAIERGDMVDLVDELGDLLLQVVYHAQLADELDSFSFVNVVDAICKKMIRRHPHVFGDNRASTQQSVELNWERIKAEERREKTTANGEQAAPRNHSRLDSVPHNLPALNRADKLQQVAARAGFDWSDVSGPLAKIDEEVAEFRDTVATGDKSQMNSELGDLLFSLVNTARHMDLDAESALRAANGRFAARFNFIEQQCAQSGQPLENATLSELDALWEQAKAQNGGQT